MDLKWSDTEELAIRLVEAHPTTDPLTVRFTDMHAWIVALPESKIDPTEFYKLDQMQDNPPPVPVEP